MAHKPEEFEPYKVVKEGVGKVQNFFKTLGGTMSQQVPRKGLSGGEAGRPSRLFKATPDQMARQEARRKRQTTLRRPGR